MRELKRLGHITPSCNTVLEPVTAMINAPLATRVSHHFARIPVGNISLASGDTDQFAIPAMVAAARSLCDAEMDAVVWNGTSGCWNGTEADVAMCAAITEATGVPASTSTLAQYDAFTTFGYTRFGLAVPYTDDVTARTIETYRMAGFSAVSHANLGLTVGRDMAYVPLDEIRRLVRAADSPEAECVVVICTGLPAALVVEEMETELGKPIFDSVAVALWRGLGLAGAQARIDGWGRLLRTPFARAN
jgi:maleate isomerase